MRSSNSARASTPSGVGPASQGLVIGTGQASHAPPVDGQNPWWVNAGSVPSAIPRRTCCS